jgi:predicted nucleotidyltransferase
MDFGLKTRDLEEIIAVLKRCPEITQAIIFGSRAKGNYKPGSDVDIAIKGADISSASVAALAMILNEDSDMPYYFDLVHYEEIAEKALADHIDRVGQVFYSA